jgi:hypothetical protein
MTENENKSIEFATQSTDAYFEKGASYFEPPEPPPTWEPPSAALVTEPAPAPIPASDES